MVALLWHSGQLREGGFSLLGSLIIRGDHFPKVQERGWVGERPAPLLHAFWLPLCPPLSPTRLVPSLLRRRLATGRLVSAVHVCVCVVRACACVSGGVTGGEERWDGGKLERGCWGTGKGGLSFSLSFSAGFSGFSFPVSISCALPLSRWFTEFCIVNSWPLRRRLLGGKVGMGLTERSAVLAAGVST